ncbi:hypothetical protein BVY02_02685 [bacterium J17]|nr:hypothetical protein BVY02_02685 [bacterium J17]
MTKTRDPEAAALEEPGSVLHPLMGWVIEIANAVKAKEPELPFTQWPDREVFFVDNQSFDELFANRTREFGRENAGSVYFTYRLTDGGLFLIWKSSSRGRAYARRFDSAEEARFTSLLGADRWDDTL